MDNKTVVTILSRRLGRETKDINALIEGLAAIIKEKCGNMDAIAIPGFGMFEATKQEEQITTDLSSGKRLLLPPEISLRFTSSAILRKKLLK